MPVWIEKITVENLGPLGNRNFTLSRFNLIYGRNETGKTYLVEFLLRSLFSHAANWQMRDGLGRGKVTIRGLEDDPLDFTPGGRSKLEDYWNKSEIGLPANMARLLVVKGGELGLTDANRTGVDRDVLRSALSSEALIDRILNRIQVTVQKAQVVDGRIEADHRGEIKDRAKLRDDLERLNDLSEEIEARYSRGRLRALELAQEELRTKLDLQRQAKRHLAFKLHQERQQLRIEQEQLPQTDLKRFEELVRDYDKATRDQEKTQEKLEVAREEAEHYSWLKQAVRVWESLNWTEVEAPSVWSMISAGASVFLSVLLALVGSLFDLVPAAGLVLAFLSVLLLMLGFGLGAFYVVKTRRQAVAAVQSEERDQIERDFEERFSRPLRGLADLRTQLDGLQKAHSRAENLEEQLDENQKELEKLEGEIERSLLGLMADPVPKSEWKFTAKSMRDKAKELEKKVHNLDLRLGKLNVNEDDHLSESGEVPYSAEVLSELESELAQVEKVLQSAQQDIESLKQEVTRETGDEINTPWETVLENFRERQREVEADYREATARILGQIAVSQVVEEIKAQEDEKIRRWLRSDSVSRILTDVTGHYHSMDYVDGDMVVRGDTADYNLAELSSGAREQVLLALRMGFASRLAASQPLFLLLDDAFQHSDWQRRAQLVDSVHRMVEKGWQVTYFTMDDHLRDLIIDWGQREWSDDFVFAEIG